MLPHGDFPSGPVARTPLSPWRGPGLIPGQETGSRMQQWTLGQTNKLKKFKKEKNASV